MKKNVAYGLLASAIMLPNLSWAETQEAKEPEKLEIPKPTVYGKLNLSQEWVSPEVGDGYSRLKSNSSRVGVKGSFTLNSQFKAIYQAEFGLDADSNGNKDKDAITRRNTFIGIDSSYGKVIAGIFDSPLKLVQNKIDLFNGVQGDIKNVFTKSEQRLENTVQYSSPKMAGFNANFAYVNADEKDGDNGYSTSLTWNHDALYLAAALDNRVLDKDSKTVRLAAQYTLGAVQLGAMWERQDDDATNKDESGWLGSLSYKATSNIALKAQYGQSDIVSEGGKTMSVGMDYGFSKNAKTYLYATQEKFDDEKKEGKYVGVGLEYSF